MGFDLNALAGKTAMVDVTFMGQTAHITYDPALLTQEGVLNAQSGDAGFIDFFTDLVKDWDVNRGTKKVPLTEDGLKGIPLPFLKAVFMRIMTDSRADEDQGKASSAG